MHFQQAHATDMHQDKTHDKLLEDKTRGRILRGELRPESCNSQKVYQFLNLLTKEPVERRNERSLDKVSTNDWIKHAKKAKK